MRRARLPLLWFAVIAAHLAVIFEASLNPLTSPFNDVNLYGYWADQMQPLSSILGVNQPWVYPFGALGPILLAKILGGTAGIMAGWLTLICALNLIGVSTIVDWGRGDKASFRSASFFVAFTILLGPVAIGRIDAAATFLAVLGLVQLQHNRVKLAMTFFTLGAWIKIWPVAAILALYLSAKSKLSSIITTIATTVVLLCFGLFLGGNSNLFSFVTTQGSRGLQVESTAATFWVWAAKMHIPGSGIYFDTQLVTNQVTGQFSSEIAALLGVVMIGALGITVWLGYRAYVAGADREQLFVLVLLTATLDLIVFNKVGSPQFEGWLAVPLMAGLLFGLPNWRTPLALGSAIALLTNLLYPIFYTDMIMLGSTGVWILTIRNLGLVSLLIWSNIRLTRMGDKRH